MESGRKDATATATGCWALAVVSRAYFLTASADSVFTKARAFNQSGEQRIGPQRAKGD